MKYLPRLNFLSNFILYNIPDFSLSDIVFFVTDGKDVNLHGHISVDKDAGKAIG
jgi:hypothetical protein